MGLVSLNLEVFFWFNIEGRLGIDNYNDNNENRNVLVDFEKLIGGCFFRILVRNRI